jgi:hypothetical protein
MNIQNERAKYSFLNGAVISLGLCAITLGATVFTLSDYQQPIFKDGAQQGHFLHLMGLGDPVMGGLLAMTGTVFFLYSALHWILLCGRKRGHVGLAPGDTVTEGVQHPATYRAIAYFWNTGLTLLGASVVYALAQGALSAAGIKPTKNSIGLGEHASPEQLIGYFAIFLTIGLITASQWKMSDQGTLGDRLLRWAKGGHNAQNILAIDNRASL